MYLTLWFAFLASEEASQLVWVSSLTWAEEELSLMPSVKKCEECKNLPVV